jgi:hypothetical protein
MEKFAYRDQITKTIIGILTRYGAERIAIFGSYARGEATDMSDIEILVRFDQPKSLFQLVDIENEHGASLHLKVDLLTEKAISPYLRESVHRDEMVIYG